MKATRQFRIYLFSTLLMSCFLTNVSEAEEVIVENFDASSLRLENIKMKLEVKTHLSEGIEIKIFTPGVVEKIIETRMSGDELVVEQLKTTSIGDISVISHGTGNGGGRSVVSIGNQTTIIEGNNIVVTQSNSQARSWMVISLPVGTPLSLENFKGKAEIGNTEGAFNMDGSGNVVAGNLTAVTLDIGKNAKVKINQVKQFLKVNASGNSKLQLQQGNVETLQVNVVGNSRVKYGGHAHEASLSVTDNGRLFIASVDKRQNSKISRNGRLSIGNW